MAFENLTGSYTYRSFLNEPSGEIANLLWAEGELFLRIEPDGTITGQLSFPAEASAAEKVFMDIAGRAEHGPDDNLSFSAVGRPDTALAEFRYSYHCRLAHDWSEAAPPQRPALVGTVIRDEDHGSEPAGATASFIAVKRDFLEPRDIEGVALIPQAVAMLADETHRLRHTVWHTVRSEWLSPALSDAARAKLRAKGWGIDDPPFRAEGGLDLTNGAGEDFLYMHRRMIKMLHEVYASQGESPPPAWNQIPSGLGPQIAYRPVRDEQSGRISYVIDRENSGLMVPPATDDFMRLTDRSNFLFFNKTALGFRRSLAQLAARLSSPIFAGTQTLGAYGNLIEFTVHNWMHMRWASTPRDPETGEPASRARFDISSKWNAAHYDYLGDFHSSHVNPIFWKLHGWVDACIDIWFQAHEALHPGEVQQKDVRGIEWFEPGKWVRKADPFDWPRAGHDGHHHHADHDELAILREVIAILDNELSPTSVAEMRTDTHISGFAADIIKLQQAEAEEIVREQQ